jgi:hypothetical protein
MNRVQPPSQPRTRILRVADEVWIAACLLHREQPSRPDFTVAEIVSRAEREGVEGRLRPGVYVHALRHCVANLPADPARYRMLYATGSSTRRLFRPGDRYDLKREGGKITPRPEDIPSSYRSLIDWYHDQYAKAAPRTGEEADALLGARGAGRHLAGQEHPDRHVANLREGWT